MKALFLFLLLSVQAFADLTVPFELDNAAVVPSGIRNPRIKNVFTWVEQKYDGKGLAMPLGKPLAHTVTWGEVIKSMPTKTGQETVAGLIEALKEKTDMGVGPGTTTGEINTAVSVTVPVFAIGLNEQNTLAVAVPVYSIKSSAVLGFVQTPGGAAFAKAAGPGKSVDVANQINGGLPGKIAALGYQPITSQAFTAVGDVKVVEKYQIPLNESNNLAVKSEFTLPTGVAPNADKIVDFATGDGNLDVGFSLLWDRKLPKNFNTNAFVGYTVQLPDRLMRRIPTSAADPLSLDRESVQRDLGDMATAGGSISYGSSTSGFWAGVGYTYQTMGATTFKGAAFNRERYIFMNMQNPGQRLETATLSVGYATIDDYRSGKFAVPMQAYVGYGHPISGMNAPAADVYSAELVMFF